MWNEESVGVYENCNGSGHPHPRGKEGEEIEVGQG
jgi:hypothetical protein